MTRNSGTSRLPIPNCLHLAGSVMLAIPQEVGNTAANLHARETLVELRIVHNTPHSLVGKHPLAVFIEPLASCHPTRRSNEHCVSWIELKRLLHEQLINRRCARAVSPII